jgi:hypothetical protein
MVTFLNFLFFQIAWFAGVLGAAHGFPWLGPLAVAVVVAYHLAHVADARSELMLLAVAAAIGLVCDSMLVATGWVTYPAGQWHPLLAPYWILTMWVAFATTFNVSMKWLRGRNILASLFGALGGPLSYLGGAKLGAATFVDTTSALTALALGWAIIMPLLMAAAAHLDGWRLGIGRRALATATES